MASICLLYIFMIMGFCVTSVLAQVDGSWGSWNNWHSCSASCNGGVRIRIRDCDNPTPSGGGDDCPGYGSETGTCNAQGCPVDGGWTEWSDWTDCTATCGGGTEIRTRTCTNPTAANGGAECVGSDVETQSCGEIDCPIHGQWTSWGDWTDCNSDCNSFRYRTCANPKPANGGRNCAGRGRETYECSIADCPVDGNWGAWSIHSCDDSCHGFKTRRCDDPPPRRGGETCRGRDRESYGECTGFQCVQNGNWGLWSNWGRCSKSCMHGVQIRTRRCNHPAPANGGKDCPETDESVQEKPCFMQTCPVDPNYQRKVVKETLDIDWGFILGTIFGCMAAITGILLFIITVRKYQLKKERDKLVEERENSKLYKEAAEMSIIPEGKRSAEARLRRKQLKAKLKRNGKMNELSPLMMQEYNDGSSSDGDYFADEDRPWSSMSSSRPGSAVSRPGTARLRPSAYGREGSTLSREDTELKREVTLLDIFADADYLKRKDNAIEMDEDETSFNGEYDDMGFEAQEDYGLYRSDTTMSFGEMADGQKPKSLLETPRPESTGPETEEMRVPTPMMMQGLQELDQALRDMAGYTEEGQDGAIPGGITNLTELLGGTDADTDINMDLKHQHRGPGVGIPTKGSASGGLSLSNAMNQKTVLAEINPIPSSQLHGAAAAGGGNDAADGGDGIPNLKSAMNKKSVSRQNSMPPAPPSLPNPTVFSRHSSLPGITVVPPSSGDGGATLEQVMSGKGGLAGVPTASGDQESTVSSKTATGVTLDQAMAGKGSQQGTDNKEGLSLDQALSGKSGQQPGTEKKQGSGLSLGQAMGGKTLSAAVPAKMFRPVTPPIQRKEQELDSKPDAGTGLSLDQAMGGKTLSATVPSLMLRPVTPPIQRKESSEVMDKPGSGLSLDQAMGGKTLSAAVPSSMLRPVTPPIQRKQGVGMMLDQDMAKQGVATTKMGHSVSVDEALSGLAKPDASPSPRRASELPDKVTFVDEVSPRKTLNPVKAPMSLQEVMAGKTGQQVRKQASGGMNLREAMAAKTGQKRGYDSVEDVMAAKQGVKQVAAVPTKLKKPLPDLPPPDEEKIWEIPRDSIELVTNIGYGTMGPVWKAKAFDLEDDSDEATSVAIKTLNEGCTPQEREEFLKEMEIMKRLDRHPYVIGMIGCCTYVDPIYMVLEYARHDALLDYLRRNRPGKKDARTPSSKILINFAIQITKGMQYLSKLKLPHGDLTARNILLGDRMTCKISNFSRERDIPGVISEPRHAIRWMGAETIATNEYTTATDIWSFGVLLWEIVTYGATPYPKMHVREVKAKVPSGYRMEIPSHCAKELYGIMLECWNIEPMKRPAFRSIGIVMDKLLADDKNYVKPNKYDRSKYESAY